MVYEPRPVATDNIVLDPQLLPLTEALAKNTHDVWAAQRVKDGWKLGPRRDDEKKEHPNLVPYEQLGEPEKDYDRKVALATLKLIVSLGWSISKTSSSEEVLSPKTSVQSSDRKDSGIDAIDSFGVDPQKPELRQFLESEGLAETEDAISKRLQLWNEDQAMIMARGAKDIETNRGYLIATDEQRALPPQANRALQLYSIADTLAIYYRNLLRKMSYWVISLAFLALLALETFHFLSHFKLRSLEESSAAAIGLFSLFWLIVIALHQLSKRREWQNRFQDYRALAEALRVQFYWSWAGLSQPVESCYLKRHRGELNWIRFVLRNWFPAADSPGTASSSPALNSWINNQLDYFAGPDRHSGAIKTNHDKNLGYQHWALVFIYVAAVLGFLAAAVTVAALPFFEETGQTLKTGETLNTVGHVLTFACGIFIILTAVCYTIRERFAFSEHEKNYTAMKNLLLKASHEQQEGQPVATTLRDLGEQALTENAEWLMLHRERHATDPKI
jgi:hypothetical protein